MAKKKKNASTTSKLSTRETQAPMVLSRPVEEPITMAPATSEAIEVVEAAVAIDRAQIAELAFAKFVARGYVPGHHVADWLAAEAELRAARNITI
jgi:hypothetical protein